MPQDALDHQLAKLQAVATTSAGASASTGARMSTWLGTRLAASPDDYTAAAATYGFSVWEATGTRPIFSGWRGAVPAPNSSLCLASSSSGSSDGGSGQQAGGGWVAVPCDSVGEVQAVTCAVYPQGE